MDAIDIDHGGIGTDTDLLSSRVGQAPTRPPGLTGGFFYGVVDEMLLQGFTSDDIGKIVGGNYCRVFGLGITQMLGFSLLSNMSSACRKVINLAV